MAESPYSTPKPSDEGILKFRMASAFPGCRSNTVIHANTHGVRMVAKSFLWHGVRTTAATAVMYVLSRLI